MKKKLIILSVSVLMFTAQFATAQIINPGFETWTNDLLVTSSQQPNSGNDTYGWWCYNTFNHSLLGSSPISVIRCTDTVRTGDYSVRLETQVYTQASWDIYKYWGIPFIGHEYNDTLGILFNGIVSIIQSSYFPGIPFDQNLDQFKFYYQYRPNGNDIAECRVSLMSNGNYVAGGTFSTDVATGNAGWQEAVIDFTYINTLTPDTLYVLFSSSSLDNKPSPGSVLWIDDVSVVLATGVEMQLGNDIIAEVFPNPTKGKFRVLAKDVENVEILSLQGKTIINNNLKEIDLSNYDNGIYFVKITTKKGAVIKKLVKN